MSNSKARVVSLSARQRPILRSFSRSKKSAASLVERARLILLTADGLSDERVAEELGVNHQRVRRWRTRWARELSSRLAKVESVADDKVLALAIEEALADRARSGAPPKFTPDQEERVRAMACRPPSEFGLPHSQWTRPLLARMAVEKGVVDSISVAEIGRWLKGGASSLTGSGTG